MEKYILEDGHSKNLKKRHNEKKKNIINKFEKNLNYEHELTDNDGVKHGNVHIDDGRRVRIKINNNKKSNYNTHYSNDDDEIVISKKALQMKGSDLTGAHEYSHALDSNGHTHRELNKLTYLGNKETPAEKMKLKKIYNNHEKQILQKNKEQDFDKKAYSEIKKLKDTTGRGLNSHDRKPNENRADVYALKKLNPSGGNIMRKNLNEVDRRQLQNKYNKKNYTYAVSEYIHAKKSIPAIDEHIQYCKDMIKKINISKNKKDNDPFSTINSINYENKLKKYNDDLKMYEDKKAKLKKTLLENKRRYKEDISKKDSLQEAKNKKEFSMIKQQNKDRFDVATKLANKK